MEVRRTALRVLRVKPSYTATTTETTNVLIEVRFTKIRIMMTNQRIECRPTNILYTINFSSYSSSSSDSPEQTSDFHISSDGSDEPRSPSEEAAPLFQQFTRNISSFLVRRLMSSSNSSDDQSSMRGRRRPSVLEIFIEIFTVKGTDQPEMIQAVLNDFMTDRTRGAGARAGVKSLIQSCLEKKKFEKRSDDDNELEDEEMNCSVCLNEFLEGVDVMVTPCKHMFHESCIWRWFWRRNQTCPLCRFNIAHV